MANTLNQSAKTNNGGYLFHFSSVPQIGTKMPYYRGNEVELIDVREYTKKDGSPGVLLVWQRSDGVKGATGLSSKSLSYPDWLKEYD